MHPSRRGRLHWGDSDVRTYYGDVVNTAVRDPNPPVALPQWKLGTEGNAREGEEHVYAFHHGERVHKADVGQRHGRCREKPRCKRAPRRLNWKRGAHDQDGGTSVQDGAPNYGDRPGGVDGKETFLRRCLPQREVAYIHTPRR